MALTLEQFVENLTRSGLMSAAELSAFRKSLAPEKRPKDAQGLARELIQAGKLTRYQAAAVYQGRTKGLVLGNYTVLDQIGAGGMGQVLKAKHRTMDRIVALKMLPARAMKSSQMVKRFHREVRAAAKLEHPNIVTAYDADEHQGIHYLVMQYVDGKDLADVVAERGPLPVEQAVECIIQAARGLEYAHSEGVVHRDIKPANLLLDKKGTVKILDMGLARLGEPGESGESESLTSTGQVMGTYDYMAPEQAEDSHSIDHRADVYSLGCTLYRLLTGERPYKGDRAIQILYAHREHPIPSLCEARPDVRAQLDAVFQKMLAKRPEDRYQSMTEVIGALETCVAVESRQPVPPPPPSDHALTSFLKHLAEEEAGPPQKPSHPQVGEETVESRGGQVTGKSFWTRLVRLENRKLITYGGVAASLAAFAIVVAVLFVLVGGGEQPKPDEDTEVATTREDSTPGDPTKPRPPLAVAPFDAEEAKRHQQAWADYRGVPVEREIDLPGGEKLTMVLIPPGEFMMGSSEEEQARFLEEAEAANDQLAIDRIPSEGPQHRVGITRPFYLGKYEVTQAQWKAVMRNNPSRFKDDPSHPVELVSWDDAQAFVAKLTESRKSQGMKFDLPTEAQWEYACRAGTTTFWHCGQSQAELQEYAWSSANSGSKTHPVGQLRPNGFGLYDMHGSVWEWCADWYAADYYAPSPADDPSGPPMGSRRVRRGGGGGQHARYCRSAFRNDNSPGPRYHYFGLRLACEVPSDPAELVKLAVGIKAAKDSHEAGIGATGIGPDGKSDPLPTGCIRRFEGHTHTVNGIAFAADGKQVISGSSDGTIRVWDIATCAEVRQLPREDLGVPVDDAEKEKGIWSVALSSDGQYCLAGSAKPSVLQWDFTSGRFIREMRGHTAPVVRLAACPVSPLIASMGIGGTVRLWDLDAGKEIHCWGEQPRFQPTSVAFTPDGRLALTGSETGEAHVWNVETGDHVRTLGGSNGSARWTQVCVSHDGTTAYTDSRDQILRAWDLESGKELFQIPGTRYAHSARLTPDGRYYVKSEDTGIWAYDLAEKTLFRVGEARGRNVTWEFDISPDGQYVVSACGRTDRAGPNAVADYRLYLWRMPWRASTSGHTLNSE